MLAFAVISPWRILASLALSLFMVCAAQAQDIESITRDIDSLQADASLDEETKAAAIRALTDARQTLVRAKDRSAEVDGFTANAATADDTLKQIELDLAALQNEPRTSLSPTLSIRELDARLVELTGRNAGLEASIAALRAQDIGLRSRSDEISREVAAARSELSQLQQAPAPESAQADPVAAANSVLQSARLAERRAAIDDLGRERNTLAARQEIVNARLNIASAQSARLTARITEIQERLGTFRGENARTLLDNVRQQLFDLPDGLQMVRQYAKDNVDLAIRLVDLVESYAPLAVEAIQLQQALGQLTASAQTVDQVLATGQLSDETAQMLRDVRSRLPDDKQLTDAMVRADQSMVALRLNLVLWQDRLRNLFDTSEVANGLLAHLDDSVLTATVQAEAASLVEQRRLLLQQLSESARSTSDQLGQQRLLRQDILGRTTDLARLLDRHLLWLPTKSGFGEAFVANLISNAAWISSPTGWRDTAMAVATGFRSAALLPLILGALALALGAFRKTIRQRLGHLAERVGNVEVDTYLTTPEALALTLMLTLPWPLGLVAIGRSAMHAGIGGFTSAISQGLLAMAGVVFILVFFRSLTLNNGVFHRHFGWSQASRRLLRFNLTWFVAVQAVVAFIFSAALASGDPVIKYGIGRLAFMVSAIAIGLFTYYFLKPVDGVLVSVSADRKPSVAWKMTFLLFVATPLIIGFLPAVGYYEAAIELQSRVFMSGVVILLAAVLYRLSMRISMVAHRRLLLRQAREKERREQEQRSASVAAEQSGEASPPMVDDDMDNLEALSHQSRRAIFAISSLVLLLGLWAIWSALLPALGIANDIILWQGVRSVEGVAVSTGISLWDLSVALLLIVGGFVLARNMGGILQLLVFERVTLVSGTRYAVVTIARYALICTGIVAGLGRLGLDWSSLQWVVAALGVGLGFGLQEIVANFVSGLIILFERPIRVGDIVTIGQLDGTVTSIQIRATKITDFDNREVLMPNKSIITENVTNWTLNDQVTRIILQFGVAYGSDIDQVRDLILDAVSKHPDTLAAPSPVVFFMAHGDSSLDFEARVFVSAPHKRLPVRHDLNRSINLTLAANGIEIPFPQRDLHIRNGGDSTPADAGPEA